MRSATLIFIATLLFGFQASAQNQLPSGHPPINSPPPEAPNPARAGGASEPSIELPAGHPPVAPQQARQGGPSMTPPATTVGTDPSLPGNSINVVLLDGNGRPIVNREVKLSITRQSVDQGNSQSERRSNTDTTGRVVYDKLDTSRAVSYRVGVEEGDATYTTHPFNLKLEAGHQVELRVYPVTKDAKQVLFGTTGTVFVGMRDDVFQFEVLYRILNIGKTTWVPRDVRMLLPEESKGFVANDSSSDIGVVRVNNSLELRGTITPGRHEVSFRFQVPRASSASQNFELALLPNVAELQIVSEAPRGLSLDVAGFPEAKPHRGGSGQSLLVTQRQLSRGEPALERLAITLSGIPTPGPARWVAVGFALLLAIGGGWLLTRSGSPKEQRAHLSHAQTVLLDELVALERAWESKSIGQNTYEHARQVLLDAAARIQLQLDTRVD